MHSIVVIVVDFHSVEVEIQKIFKDACMAKPEFKSGPPQHDFEFTTIFLR